MQPKPPTQKKVGFTKRRRNTGPMRLPQQMIPLSRVPYSDPTGATRGTHIASYHAQATEGDVTYYVRIPGSPPTQRDRDVLEMLFATCEPIAKDRTITYRFEAYGFLRRLGYKNPGERDAIWLSEVLGRWIRRIEIKMTAEGRVEGSVAFAIVARALVQRVWTDEGVRWIGEVDLQPEYVKMLRKHMHLSYHSLVPQIVVLPNDLAKAIARTMLGHRYRHRTLLDMLCDLGVHVADIAERTRRKYRSFVAQATDQLAALGIRVVETGPGLAGLSLHLDEQPDGVYTSMPSRSPVAGLLGLAAPESIAS